MPVRDFRNGRWHPDPRPYRVTTATHNPAHTIWCADCGLAAVDRKGNVCVSCAARDTERDE